MICSCSCGSSMIYGLTTTLASIMPCPGLGALCPCSVSTLGTRTCCVHLMALKVSKQWPMMPFKMVRSELLEDSKQDWKAAGHSNSHAAFKAQAVVCVACMYPPISTNASTHSVTPPTDAKLGSSSCQSLPAPHRLPYLNRHCSDQCVVIQSTSPAHSWVGAAAALLHQSRLR